MSGAFKMSARLVAEAKNDLRLLYDPRSICHADGRYEQSLARKWGLSVAELEARVGRPKYIEVWEDPNGAAVPERPEPATWPAPESTWLHANGHHYLVLAIANQRSTKPKFQPTVVYRCLETGELHARLVVDWLLRVQVGKFRQVVAAPRPPAAQANPG